MGDETVTIVNRAPHIRHAVRRMNDATLFLVIEANLKDPPAYAGSLLDDFLEDCLAASDGQLAPLSVAEVMSETLRQDVRYRPMGAVFYAGVNVQGAVAEVCTAGDLRVHLIRGGKVEAVTRDHNAVAD